MDLDEIMRKAKLRDTDAIRGPASSEGKPKEKPAPQTKVPASRGVSTDVLDMSLIPDGEQTDFDRQVKRIEQDIYQREKADVERTISEWGSTPTPSKRADPPGVTAPDIASYPISAPSGEGLDDIVHIHTEALIRRGHRDSRAGLASWPGADTLAAMYDVEEVRWEVPSRSSSRVVARFSEPPSRWQKAIHADETRSWAGMDCYWDGEVLIITAQSPLASDTFSDDVVESLALADVSGEQKTAIDVQYGGSLAGLVSRLGAHVTLWSQLPWKKQTAAYVYSSAYGDMPILTEVRVVTEKEISFVYAFEGAGSIASIRSKTSLDIIAKETGTDPGMIRVESGPRSTLVLTFQRERYTVKDDSYVPAPEEHWRARSATEAVKIFNADPVLRVGRDRRDGTAVDIDLTKLPWMTFVGATRTGKTVGLLGALALCGNVLRTYIIDGKGGGDYIGVVEKNASVDAASFDYNTAVRVILEVLYTCQARKRLAGEYSRAVLADRFRGVSDAPHEVKELFRPVLLLIDEAAILFNAWKGMRGQGSEKLSSLVERKLSTLQKESGAMRIFGVLATQDLRADSVPRGVVTSTQTRLGLRSPDTVTCTALLAGKNHLEEEATDVWKHSNGHGLGAFFTDAGVVPVQTPYSPPQGYQVVESDPTDWHRTEGYLQNLKRFEVRWGVDTVTAPALRDSTRKKNEPAPSRYSDQTWNELRSTPMLPLAEDHGSGYTAVNPECDVTSMGHSGAFHHSPDDEWLRLREESL